MPGKLGMNAVLRGHSTGAFSTFIHSWRFAVIYSSLVAVIERRANVQASGRHLQRPTVLPRLPQRIGSSSGSSLPRTARSHGRAAAAATCILPRTASATALAGGARWAVACAVDGGLHAHH